MPAEWAPHRGTWLSWPHRESTWPGMLERIPPIFADIVAHLVPAEEVHINLKPGLEDGVRALLASRGVPPDSVFFHHHPTDDAWCRDHGPIFIQRTSGGRVEEAIVDWGYNSWGGKYPPCDRDDAIPGRIARELGLPLFHPGMILEGGSIDVNGVGDLLTTESCLLNPNRNPDLSRADIERRLGEFLGVDRVLWLGQGIVGDDTDGHVDDLARFVAPDTIVTVVEDDPDDDNYRPLQDNLHRLRGLTRRSGEPYRIVELPMPRPRYHGGERLPASYANFYVANEVVLLPGYDADRDAIARDILGGLFPRRRVVVIDSLDLVWGLGSFHCVTQQWPATG